MSRFPPDYYDETNKAGLTVTSGHRNGMATLTCVSFDEHPLILELRLPGRLAPIAVHKAFRILRENEDVFIELLKAASVDHPEIRVKPLKKKRKGT